MMRRRFGFCVISVFIFLSLIFVSGEDTTSIIEATEGKMPIYYNGSLVRPEKEPLIVNDSVYLSLKDVAGLFNKSVNRDAQTGGIVMADKPDALLAVLKEELARRDFRIKELENNEKQLEDKVKQLESEAADQRMNMSALEKTVNAQYGTYEGVSFIILLSGDENEVRIRLLTDLEEYDEAWEKLNSAKKLAYLQELSGTVTAKNPFARVTGCIMDMEKYRRLMVFHSTPTREIKIGLYENYSLMSSLEEQFNAEYCDYFKGIFLAFKVSGNGNRPVFEIYLPYEKYREEWEKISDYRVKSLMSKLTGDIEDSFKDSIVYGYLYDTDSKIQIASSWKEPGKSLDFERDK